MKTYKTSEMIAMLEENPKLKFKAIKKETYLTAMVSPQNDLRPMLAYESRKNHFDGMVLCLDEKWTLVKPEPKPVSFMEAMNQRLRCKPKNPAEYQCREFREPNHWMAFEFVTLEQVNGQWLIEEPDNE